MYNIFNYIKNSENLLFESIKNDDKETFNITLDKLKSNSNLYSQYKIFTSIKNNLHENNLNISKDDFKSVMLNYKNDFIKNHFLFEEELDNKLNKVEQQIADFLTEKNNFKEIALLNDIYDNIFVLKNENDEIISFAKSNNITNIKEYYDDLKNKSIHYLNEAKNEVDLAEDKLLIYESITEIYNMKDDASILDNIKRLNELTDNS